MVQSHLIGFWFLVTRFRFSFVCMFAFLCAKLYFPFFGFRNKTCGCSWNELHLWRSASSSWWDLCEGSDCVSRLLQRWSPNVLFLHTLLFYGTNIYYYLNLPDCKVDWTGVKSLIMMDGCIQETLGHGYLEAALRLLIGSVLIILIMIFKRIDIGTTWFFVWK